MPFTTVISATDLSPHIGDPTWIIVDCRHDLADPDAGRRAYAEGHLTGAVFASIDDALSAKSRDGKFRGRHPLPEREAFADTLRRWGISENSQVVAYDAQGGMFAARLWWMLRWVGHAAVAVLDGGLPAWTAAGGALTQEMPVRARGTLVAHSALTREVDADTVLANLRAPAFTVLDARAPDRFRGENETLDPVGGHIPGARNAFFRNNLQEDQRFKSPEVLRKQYSELIDAPGKTVMQCGSGVTACHNLLAMEIAGLSGAALYPGSWSEWCSDPSRPVARGEG